MYKISEFYKNARLTFVLTIFNTIVVFLLLCSINEVEKNKFVFLILLGIAPSLIFLILTIILNVFKEKTSLISIIRIISYILLFLYIFYFMLVYFCYIAIMADNPEVSIESYNYNKKINYFPKEIPKEYEDVAYYHKYPFMYGEKIILYLKIDEQLIKEYKKEFENKTVEREKNMSKYVEYSNTPYEDKSTEGFDWYIIESKCDDSNYCNHGIDKHVRINEETNEIIFYYHDR